jgi:hypothetical protein
MKHSARERVIAKKFFFIGDPGADTRKYNRFTHGRKLTVQVRGNSISHILRGQTAGTTDLKAGAVRPRFFLVSPMDLLTTSVGSGRNIQLSLSCGRQKLGYITGTTNVGIHKP